MPDNKAVSQQIARRDQETAMTDTPITDVVVNAVSKVPGVIAVSLGGSRALGLATPESDFDIMIFQARVGDIKSDDLRKSLEQIADNGVKITGEAVLAEFGLHKRKVELFFQNTEMISKEIESARQGGFTRWPHMLHPQGFLSTVLISYIAYGQPMWDPQGILASFRQQITPYPEALRMQMLQTYRMEAGLNLIHAAKVKRPVELPYLAALYARVVSCWSLSLFAINRRYPLIDKGAQQIIMSLPVHPQHFHGRTIKLFSDIAAGNLEQARIDAGTLHKEIATLP